MKPSEKGVLLKKEMENDLRLKLRVIFHFT